MFQCYFPNRSVKNEAKAVWVSAVSAVGQGMSYKTADKFHNIPRSTLQEYVNDISLNLKEAVTAVLGRKPVLCREIDDILFSYFIDIDESCFGLSAADVRHLAYQLATRSGLPHPFTDDKTAGNKWLKTFFRRHPHLSVSSPQGPLKM